MAGKRQEQRNQIDKRCVTNKHLRCRDFQCSCACHQMKRFRRVTLQNLWVGLWRSLHAPRAQE